MTFAAKLPAASANEGGAVVHEALAFDQRHEAPRKAEALRNRGGGSRIRRRDHCAEHECLAPAQAGDELVRDHRDDDHRAEHEPDREEGDREGVLTEVAERREERGTVEERWEDRDEDEVRRELNVGYARDEPEPEPADDEQDRVRDVRPLRRDEEQRDGRDDGEKGEAVFDGKRHRLRPQR
jgi:hypothetical protein